MKRLIATTALVTTLIPAATALASPPTPDAAMRKGVRDYARSVHATASGVEVHCRPAPHVDAVAGCRGNFRLTKADGSSSYALTDGASVLRISPNAIEYRVEARTGHAAPGMPRTTGVFGGFLQGS